VLARGLYNHKKTYVQKRWQRLHLEDGGRVDKETRTSESKINRKCSPKDLLLIELEHPRPIGIKGSLRRRVIYEDVD
jgi:hypothetical protein